VKSVEDPCRSLSAGTAEENSVDAEGRGAARSAAQTLQGGSALTSTSPSLPRSTTNSSLSKAEVVEYVESLLVWASDWQSITITRQDSSEDFLISIATSASSEPETQKSLSEQLLTSLILRRVEFLASG
jgi:hypothetical protein